MNITSCFELLKNQESFLLNRRVIAYSLFSKLRRNMRMIIQANLEGGTDRDIEIAYVWRKRLSEWLTVPVPFDQDLMDTLQLLGNLDSVNRIYEKEIGNALDAALAAAHAMQQTENPLISALRDEIEKLFREGKDFRIYAHPKSVRYYSSLSENLTEQHFLYGNSRYGAIEPVDVLLKIGPLRSIGWGKCPDALLTSPRFRTLTQFVWTELSDEERFGLDPVSGEMISDVLANRGGKSVSGFGQSLQWSVNVVRYGDPVNDPENDPTDDPYEDDFSFLFRLQKEYADRNQARSASLIKFVNGYGILVPSGTDVLEYDPERFSVDLVSPVGAHLDGSIFVLPVIEMADFGGVHVDKVSYSGIWKRHLSEVIGMDHEEFCLKLQDEGVGLINICSRVQEWCTPPRTVIPAPQKWEHFSALISVLANRYQKMELQDENFAKKAWAEIRRSKGKAITEGRQEHQVQRELEYELLKSLIPQITGTQKAEDEFEINIPPEHHELKGLYRFFSVASVEEGLTVPETVLHEIHSIPEFDIWRG